MSDQFCYRGLYFCGSERSSLFVLHKFSKLGRQTEPNKLCLLLVKYFFTLYNWPQTISNIFEKFRLVNLNWLAAEIATILFYPSVGRSRNQISNTNYYCWTRVKCTVFHFELFFSKLKKFPFCLFNIRHYVKLIDWCFTQELNNY